MFEVSQDFEITFLHQHLELGVAVDMGDDGIVMQYPEPHGHNARITLCYKSETLNEFGHVLADESMSAQREWIEQNVNMKNLNELLQANGSPSNLAKFLYDYFKTVNSELFKVIVKLSSQRVGIYIEQTV